MAETISGGATRRPDGTWQDAEGRPLAPEARRAAEHLAAETARARQQAEAQRAAQELASDPATRAALRALGVAQGEPEPVKPEPVKPAKEARNG